MILEKFKFRIICYVFLFFIPSAIQAQGLNINTNAILLFSGEPILIINDGGLINNGNYSKANETVSFTGTMANSITGNSATSIQNLHVINTGGITTYLNQLTAKDLTIHAASKLTIETSKTVTVSNAVTNNNGIAGILLKSRKNEPSATFVFNNTAPQATVEMYTLASKISDMYRWQYFGIPITTLALTSPSPFSGSYVRLMVESGATTAAHWVQLTNASTMNAFNGYEITQASDKVVSFKGTLVNNNYTSGNLGITSNSIFPGQHLIGNSYTAAINISDIEFGTGNIDNAVTLYSTGSNADWAGVGGAGSTQGSNPGQYLTIPYQNAGVGGLPSQIPSMQAFIVKVNDNSGNTNLSIPYSTVKSISTVQRNNSVPKTCTKINVTSENSIFSDVMWLITTDNSTHAYENGWDGLKYLSEFHTAPQIFARELSGNYQVNSVDDVDNTLISFVRGQSSNYTFTFTHENLANKYQSLFLKNLQSNEIIEITETGTQYSFEASGIEGTESRFLILKSPDNAVNTIDPIEKNLLVWGLNKDININNISSSNGTLCLYDLGGRILMYNNFTANSETIIPTQLSTGIYVAKLKLKNSDFEIISKIYIK